MFCSNSNRSDLSDKALRSGSSRCFCLTSAKRAVLALCLVVLSWLNEYMVHLAIKVNLIIQKQECCLSVRLLRSSDGANRDHQTP